MSWWCNLYYTELKHLWLKIKHIGLINIVYRPLWLNLVHMYAMIDGSSRVNFNRFGGELILLKRIFFYKGTDLNGSTKSESIFASNQLKANTFALINIDYYLIGINSYKFSEFLRNFIYKNKICIFVG